MRSKLSGGVRRVSWSALRLDKSGLDEDEALTAAVVIQQASALIDKIDARMVEYSITDFNYVGAAATLLTLMPVATVSDSADTDAYLARLRAIPAYLEAVADRHRIGASAGRMPVRRLVDAAVAHLDRYLADPVGDPLLGPKPRGGMVTLHARRRTWSRTQQGPR